MSFFFDIRNPKLNQEVAIKQRDEQIESLQNQIQALEQKIQAIENEKAQLVQEKITQVNDFVEAHERMQYDKLLLEEQQFINASLAKFTAVMRWQEEQTLRSWCNKLLDELIPFIKANQAVLYYFDKQQQLFFVAGSYAVATEKLSKKTFAIGEGWIGQAAESGEVIEIQENKSDYFSTRIADVQLKAKAFYAIPLLYNEQVYGVLEVLAINPLTEKLKRFLDTLRPSIASDLNALIKEKQLIKTFKNVQQSEERFRILSEVTLEGIAFVDNQMKITEANPAFLKMFGYESIEQALGIDARSLLKAERQDLDVLRLAPEQLRERQLQDFRGVRKNGSSFPIELQARKVQINEISLEIISFLDVSERKAAEQKLQKTQAELAESLKVVELLREIEQQNKRMTESIQYAKRIQESILPDIEDMRAAFNDFFLFYRPRDVVSGDFYWFVQKNKKVWIAAVDCTGHGVPGALMSILGHSILNRLVKEEGRESPADILNRLDASIIELFSHKRNTEKAPRRDGMDLALCMIDYETQKVNFAGAYRPLLHVSSGKLKKYEGTRMPIGIFRNKEKPSFEERSFSFENNDIIYMYSDGYPDQFGGEQGMKYMTKRFRSFLHQISALPLEEQSKKLAVELDNWQGNESQIDDIIVMAMRL
ncbi:MAG: SpoIIE family protein phosphatase [Bernardetiaceae bacterium]|nr:SpoIIE family protein phosphatase [Bernardetiaceae bacterium]